MFFGNLLFIHEANNRMPNSNLNKIRLSSKNMGKQDRPPQTSHAHGPPETSHRRVMDSQASYVRFQASSTYMTLLLLPIMYIHFKACKIPMYYVTVFWDPPAAAYKKKYAGVPISATSAKRPFFS